MLDIKTILLLNKNLTNFDKKHKEKYKFAEKFTLREKQGQKFGLNSKRVDCISEKMVVWGGIEPPTRRFSVCCSTD